MTVLAIDLGGTRLRLGLGDGRSDWQRQADHPRPGDGGPEAVIDMVARTLAAWGVAGADLKGIGASVAGLVDPDGSVTRAENLGWTDVPFRRRLVAAFDVPVAVETDVFCGARYEATAGAARDRSAALYVAVGTGIGHAVVISGRVWRGSRGNANGFGHLAVTPDGARCYCGNVGCLCLLAGGKAQSAAVPPAGALSAFARALGWTATLLEPEVIVLSGGALSLPWFDLAALEAEMKGASYPGVVPPALTLSQAPDPNLRGAALLLENDDDP